jgi:predicted nucleic acid-binding protein
MIVLDTNVISEAFRPAPNTEVGEWLRRQPKDRLFVTSVNRAELLTGLALMPDGKRKQSLAEAISAFFDHRLLTPVLAFDDEAAFQYARIFSQRRKSGRPIAELDCQIAAIALVHGHAVATRNIWDFENCGIAVINPWAAQPQ